MRIRIVVAGAIVAGAAVLGGSLAVAATTTPGAPQPAPAGQSAPIVDVPPSGIAGEPTAEPAPPQPGEPTAQPAPPQPQPTVRPGGPERFTTKPMAPAAAP